MRSVAVALAVLAATCTAAPVGSGYREDILEYAYDEYGESYVRARLHNCMPVPTPAGGCSETPPDVFFVNWEEANSSSIDCSFTEVTDTGSLIMLCESCIYECISRFN